MKNSALTKDNVRDIIREEFNLMRSTLVQELHQTIKQIVKTELQSIKLEITSLENSVKFLDENYESTKTVITSYQDTVGRLQKENVQLTNTIQDLQVRLQVIEQHNRSNNLEIQCVPEHKQENLLATVIQLSKAVSCELKETDIHHCTRVAKSNKDDKRPWTIVVKLAPLDFEPHFWLKLLISIKLNPTIRLTLVTLESAAI